MTVEKKTICVFVGAAAIFVAAAVAACYGIGWVVIKLVKLFS